MQVYKCTLVSVLLLKVVRYYYYKQTSSFSSGSFSVYLSVLY